MTDANNRPVFFVPDDKHYTNFLKIMDRMGQSSELLIIQDEKLLQYLDYYYIPVPGYLGHLGNEGLILTDTVRKVLKDPKSLLFVDCSWEPLTFHGYTSRDLLALHQLLASQNISPDRVTCINANYQTPYGYEEWIKEHAITNKITMIGLNFFFQYYWELALSPWFRQNYLELWSKAKEIVTNNLIRPKKFMYLNLKPRPHRTATVLHLIERGYLSDGLVTYMGSKLAQGDFTASLEEKDEVLSFIQSLPSANRLMSQLETLQSLEPITFDRTSDVIVTDIFGRDDGADLDFLIPEVKFSGQAAPEIMSYFEIISGTWFTNFQNLSIDEKTIRSIIRFQPFIHMGPPRLLAYLKSMGFHTFSPYINESYDNIEDPSQRLEAIFTQIDCLCNMSYTNLHAMYQQLWPTLEHNFFHLLRESPRIFKQEYAENVRTKLKPGFIDRNWWGKLTMKGSVKKINSIEQTRKSYRLSEPTPFS